MNNYLLHNKPHKFTHISIALFILFFIIGFWGTPAYSQGMGMGKHPSPESEQTLTDQISEIRSKLFSLEAALVQKHQGKPGMNRAMTNETGMQKMRPTGKMNPQGRRSLLRKKMKNLAGTHGDMNPGLKMNGMGMMGRMNDNPNVFLPSFLPGFPGMSHIYHMGSTEFFLDHSSHISLTKKQESKLNKIKQQTGLDNSTMDRKVQQLEQELWVLTSSDSPDIKQIEEKIKEIEQIKVKMRLTFIQAVGEAAKVLSPEQLEELKGMKHESN